jgi:hypothetical protein
MDRPTKIPGPEPTTNKRAWDRFRAKLEEQQQQEIQAEQDRIGERMAKMPYETTLGNRYKGPNKERV